MERTDVGPTWISQDRYAMDLYRCEYHSNMSAVDAFAYDSNSASKTLIAVDDVSWPKYAFSYDLSQHPPKVITLN
jgi:hypothetical protein